MISVANGKIFGSYKLSVELLKLLFDDDAGLSSFHDTIVDI